MKAIRKIVRSDHKTLNISIPADFCDKDLELIILPYENGQAKANNGSQMAYKDFILGLPVMSEEQFGEWESDKTNLYSWFKG